MGEYDSAVALAQRLIAKKGAAAILRASAKAPPPDPSKPWKPGARSDVDQNIKAVFLDYKQSVIDGSRIKQGDQRVLVASTDDLGNPVAPTTNHRIIRGSEDWQVMDVATTKPGDQVVYFELQVRR